MRERERESTCECMSVQHAQTKSHELDEFKIGGEKHALLVDDLDDDVKDKTAVRPNFW